MCILCVKCHFIVIASKLHRNTLINKSHNCEINNSYLFGPHFCGFSLKTCQKQAKYVIIVQIYLQSILKSLGNAPKMTILLHALTWNTKDTKSLFLISSSLVSWISFY